MTRSQRLPSILRIYVAPGAELRIVGYWMTVTPEVELAESSTRLRAMCDFATVWRRRCATVRL